MTAVVWVPMRVERWALAGRLRGVAVRRTGMGRRAVGRPGQPGDGVLIAGVCGALSPALAVGDVVVATEVRGSGEPVRCPSAGLLAAELRRLGLPVHEGPVLTSDRLVDAAPARAELAAGGALAVDLESYPLAVAAGDRPLAVVRVVTDTPARPLRSVHTLVGGVVGLARLRATAPALRAWALAVGPRQVTLAAPRSFCAGVERAIDIVERALAQRGAPVYVRKQIVHNAHVVGDLRRRGAVFVDELDEVPSGATVVFSAHGVAPQVRSEAERRDLQVIDATCPLVAKVHAEARRYASRGDTVLLIGHGGHEEVEGTLGEAPGAVRLVESVADARSVTVPDQRRVSYLMQTTLAVDEADRIASVLRSRFPGVQAPRSDDICYATTNRQQAVRAVAEDAELVLVVGSPNSSNSRRLVEVAQREGSAAELVDDAGEVQLSWLADARRVGVTAGASAPPALVDDIVAALRGLGPVRVRERSVAAENVAFTLPKEVTG